MMNDFMNIFVSLDTFVGLILVVSALWIFISSRFHLLAVLMSLEGMMLGQFLLLATFLLRLGAEYYFLLFFLVVVVCEAALGLSILVSIVRTHGNDYFTSFNTLQC
uniref:NADH-ubiquinone oxidoreductase chain 4L n=1 Tax=Triops cancriformis TaxID=194544 RepID=Q8HCU3_TRICB|nr:NADH dehydrogenase subunit 4L [Triops cancriformis]QCZ36071.1 NADH dehydrogenase subunit 4L [Triops cancriformis]QCZ36084.1 NADH dehydrogenase subunit 4L [Triops cancriformis]BAC53603.1 NADH dehydrogenae subunit 4L [Triops cancriformis]